MKQLKSRTLEMFVARASLGCASACFKFVHELVRFFSDISDLSVHLCSHLIHMSVKEALRQQQEKEAEERRRKEEEAPGAAMPS